MPTYSRETLAWASHQDPQSKYLASQTSSCSSDCSRPSCSSDSGSSRPSSPDIALYQEPEAWLAWYPAIVQTIGRQVCWYPALLLEIAWQMILQTSSRVLKLALRLVLTTPLSVFRWIIGAPKSRGKTVLITGNSLQTLQLARNYEQSGARVVLLQPGPTTSHTNYSASPALHNPLDQLPSSLLYFSTAIDKVCCVSSPYINTQAYISDVCRVAERERASYFIPTSSPSQYEAVVKPYLEKLGVSCVCPGVKDTLMLEDPLTWLQLCHNSGLVTPVNYRVSSVQHLTVLYEQGHLRRARHVLVMMNRVELELPVSKRAFRRLLHTTDLELSATRPGLVIEVPEGERLVTCSTVKENRLVGNVTCKAPCPGEAHSLEPIHRQDVDILISKLITKLPRSFNGHLSLTVICTRHGLVPIRCQLGVSLPYLCYSEHQARIFLRSCKHQSQPPVTRPRYWLQDSLSRALINPCVSSMITLLATVITRREALFTLWDPVPACLYYGLYIPARLVRALVWRQATSRDHHYSSKHVHFSDFNSQINISSDLVSDKVNKHVRFSDVTSRPDSNKRRSDSVINREISETNCQVSELTVESSLNTTDGDSNIVALSSNVRCTDTCRHVYFSDDVSVPNDSQGCKQRQEQNNDSQGCKQTQEQNNNAAQDVTTC